MAFSIEFFRYFSTVGFTIHFACNLRNISGFDLLVGQFYPLVGQFDPLLGGIALDDY